MIRFYWLLNIKVTWKSPFVPPWSLNAWLLFWQAAAPRKVLTTFGSNDLAIRRHQVHYDASKWSAGRFSNSDKALTLMLRWCSHPGPATGTAGLSFSTRSLQFKSVTILIARSINNLTLLAGLGGVLTPSVYQGLSLTLTSSTEIWLKSGSQGGVCP
jgi:hypothetical protein